MKRLILIIFIGLLAALSNLSYAKTINVKVGAVIDSTFFKNLDTILRSENFAPDEIISLYSFHTFDTFGINTPETYPEYVEVYDRLKVLRNGPLPDDYYIVVGPHHEHYNRTDTGEEVVLVKYNCRSYYLPEFLDDVLFRVIETKSILQVEYRDEKILKILEYGMAHMPVIHVKNGNMSYLDKKHPIYLFLHE